MNGKLCAAAKLGDGFRSQYAVKLLTLTCPGAAYRSTRTPVEACREMAANFHKLTRALKSKYGNFHYFRVREFHKDGFPHFHVLLVGKAIAPKAILKDIRNLWTHSYNMGNIDIKPVTKSHSIERAINYIMKYISKDFEYNEDFKGMRIYSASKGGLEPAIKNKSEWLAHRVEFGAPVDGLEGFQVYDLFPSNNEWIAYRAELSLPVNGKFRSYHYSIDQWMYDLYLPPGFQELFKQFRRANTFGIRRGG